MKALVCSAEWSPRLGYKISDIEIKIKKAKNGNMVFKNPKIELRDIPKPKIGPRDVLIKLKACGICGTDLHFIETDKDGYMLFPGWTRFPIVIGHEISGVIVEKGDMVRGLNVGDWVCSEQMLWCGECDICKSGHLAQCRYMEELGVNVDGGLAEYVRVKGMHCWKINELIDIYDGDEDKIFAAATVEPTSVAYKSIFDEPGGFKPGSYVVIYGAGPIGLSAIAICKTSGASKIICFETIPNRQNLAEKIGADYIFDPTKISTHEKVMEITNGCGADFQLEAAGALDKTMTEMELSMAIGGKISLVGLGPKNPIIDASRLQFYGSQLTGTVGHGGKSIFRNVIRLMASGSINTLPYITSKFSLDKVIDAFDEAKKRTGGKVMVCM